MSPSAGSTTRCFKAATAGRCRVPVRQALNLQTNTLWLSDAGRCADVPVPAAERVQVLFRGGAGSDVPKAQHRRQLGKNEFVVNESLSEQRRVPHLIGDADSLPAAADSA